MSFIEKISTDFPVGNAAGWCKSVEEVERLAQSAAQFIVVGSITKEERAGNPGNTFDGEKLNSLGLPNPGIDKIAEMSNEILQTAHAKGKPVILSIAGFTPREYATLAVRAESLGFDGIEVNLGCPNVADGGKRKDIASFDLILMEEICSSVINLTNTDFFVSVKVSPMSNPRTIIESAEVIARCGVDAIVTQNTFPNALLYNNDGSPVIQTPDGTGWAGLSGKDVKAMALGQVSQWRASLDAANALDIAVCGVGGLNSGQDAKDLLTAGATRLQVGTAYFITGAKYFGDLANQFIHLNQ